MAVAGRDQLDEITNTLETHPLATAHPVPSPAIDQHGLKRRIPSAGPEAAGRKWDGLEGRKRQMLDQTTGTHQQAGAAAAGGGYAHSPSMASIYAGNPQAAGVPGNVTQHGTQHSNNTSNLSSYSSTYDHGLPGGTYGGMSNGYTVSSEGSAYMSAASTGRSGHPSHGQAATTCGSTLPAPPGMYHSVAGSGFPAPGDQGVATEFAPRNCQCGIPCPPRVSQSAANTGRTFFACTKSRDDQTRCRFFEWADGLNSMGGVARAGDNAADRSHPSNMPESSMPGPAGGGGACFKCGQPGHWSRDCPNRSSTAGGGNGGAGGYRAGGGAVGGVAGGPGGGGSGTCFSCGEAGHWSRDCPKKGTSNSYSAGGSYGGGYGRSAGGGQGGGFGSGGGKAGAGNWGGGGKTMTCYKCGQPGHFSSSCPNQ